jgi:hypothetical protein
MPTKTREELLLELTSAVRINGEGPKITAQDLRTFLTSLIDELLERTDGETPLPDTGLGQLRWKGFYDASSSEGLVTSSDPTLNGQLLPPASDENLGFYFIVTAGGTVDDIAHPLEVGVGDWIVSNGLAGGYIKIDNTDAVLSVNGQTGAVVLDKAAVGLGAVDNSSDVDKPVSSAQQAALDAKQDKVLTGYAKATAQAALAATDNLLTALGKLEKKADDALNQQIAYTVRGIPDTSTNKVRFDKNAQYQRTTTALTAAHFVAANDAANVPGITVRIQYFGTTAPVFPANYNLIAGGFITNITKETVLYLTYVASAVTGTAMVEVTMSQY